MRPRDYLIMLALMVALAYGAYYLGDKAGAERHAAAFDPLRAQQYRAAERLAKIEMQMASFDTLRLDMLEMRLVELEAAPIRAGAPPAEAWSDADVAALRVGLERVKAVEQRDRDAQRFRQVVAHIIPDAEPTLRERAVELLLETIDMSRMEPSQGEAHRATLLAHLQALFPAETATRIARVLPGGKSSEEPR